MSDQIIITITGPKKNRQLIANFILDALDSEELGEGFSKGDTLMNVKSTIDRTEEE